MNLFSVNQVNQVYVLGGQGTVKTPSDNQKPAEALVNEGDVVVGTTNDGKHYFIHKGKGGITRSDIIENILWTNATPAAAMTKSLKRTLVKLNAAFVDEDGNVAPVGQDFLLRLEFTGYIGVSPEDSQYWKYGVVHTLANMKATDFYKKMAISLVKNMSREAVKFIKVSLVTATTPVEVTMANINTVSGTFTGIYIDEVEPDWILGLKQQKVMSFNAVPTTVAVLNDNGTYDDLVWGDVTTSEKKKYTGGGTVAEVSNISSNDAPSAAGTIINSKLAADYEYFFHGERGDQYRMVGWPDYIPTEYMVNASNTFGYDFIQIHYAYIGANEGCQKSEKDIVFLCERTSGSEGLDTKANALKSAINTKFGANTIK